MRAIVAWYRPAVAVLIAAWSTGSRAPQEAALHLADGTRIPVRLLQFVSSETLTPGEPVHFAIAEDIVSGKNESPDPSAVRDESDQHQSMMHTHYFFASRWRARFSSARCTRVVRRTAV